MAYDSEHGKLWQDVKADVDKLRVRASKVIADAQWAFGRRTARVLGVVMLFVVVVALLLVFLDWYINPTEASDKKDLILATAQILAGTALLSGLYFTWRTLQVNREGQITERFTRAIEQLGATHDDKSKNLELRLGGIYALERIARESEEDHRSIMEVLTAYVRQHAPWQPEDAQQVEGDAAAEKKSEEDSREESETAEVPPYFRVRSAAPAADIQAIMTVIGRRTRSYGQGDFDLLDLLDLHETNLWGAFLWEADLSGAILWGANLSHTSLREADLSGAILSEADLSEADLSGAILWGAILSGADLSGAILSGAGLLRADLSGAKNLTQAQLKETTGDENTQLPADLKPPAHWTVKTVKTDEQIEED